MIAAKNYPIGENIYVTGAGGYLGGEFTSYIYNKKTQNRVVPVSGKALSKTYSNAIQTELFRSKWYEDIAKSSVLVHFAGNSNPRGLSDSISKIVEEQVLQQLKLFENIVSANVLKRIVFISSGGTIYGNAKEMPIREDHPTLPIGDYAFEKLMLENALNFLGQKFGIEVVILRVSNPFGGLVIKTSQGAIPIILRCLRDDKPFQIFGDGEDTRDYLHITDLSEAIYLSATQPIEKSGITFNVGSGVGRSLNSVIGTLEKITNKKLHKSYIAVPDTIKANFLDVTKIRNHFGWQPAVTFEDGLQELFHAHSRHSNS